MLFAYNILIFISCSLMHNSSCILLLGTGFVHFLHVCSGSSLIFIKSSGRILWFLKISVLRKNEVWERLEKNWKKSGMKKKLKPISFRFFPLFCSFLCFRKLNDGIFGKIILILGNFPHLQIDKSITTCHVSTILYIMSRHPFMCHSFLKLCGNGVWLSE